MRIAQIHGILLIRASLPGFRLILRAVQILSRLRLPVVALIFVLQHKGDGSMNPSKFLQKKYSHRTEFIEVIGLYDSVDISDELQAFLDSADLSAYEDKFREMHYGKYPEYLADIDQKTIYIPRLAVLKWAVKNELQEDKWEFPVEEVKDLKAGVEIRGLDGLEFARINSQALEDRQKIAIDLLAAGSRGAAQAIVDYLGAGKKLPEVARRIALFESGLVKPELPPDKKREVAVKLNMAFPIDFKIITDRILVLTGAGKAPEG